MERTCSVPSCSRVVYARGLCQAHYRRQRKTGAVGAAEIVAPLSRKAPCAVDGCDRKTYCRGWCYTHYARSLRDGEPGPAEIVTPQTRGGVCAVDGCANPIQSRGWCTKHYTNFLKRGDADADGPGQGKRPYPPKWEGKDCSVPGCNRPVKTSGYCTLHYQRVGRFGEPGLARAMRAAKGESDFIDTHGYRVVTHPVTKRPILEHRLVVEQLIGRPLLSNETVHHRNGKRSDNRVKNLELWAKSQPAGQRIGELVEWAKSILDLYGEVLYEQPSLFK